MVQSFGGSWTKQKLEILERYLDRYTTALKNQDFRLIYVDAFAGEGVWQTKSDYDAEDYGEYREMVYDGSARIALNVEDKPFDKLVFIEQDSSRCASLQKLRSEYPRRYIAVQNEDANVALASFCSGMQNWDRAVVFLDPFATEVRWETIEKIAGTKKIDCWILFPLSAVTRMLPTDGTPPIEWQNKLDLIFGGREYWQSMYRPSLQPDLWGERKIGRDSGSEAIANRYRERLENVFTKVAPTRKTLRNSKNVALFELFLGAGDPRGAPIAVDIADHILKNW